MTIPGSDTPGLYIHIPFCRERCGYCTFVSGAYDEETAWAYIDALLAELNRRDVFSASIRPSTLFIGGGTPSMLSAAQLDKLLSGLPSVKREATCEVNPDSITLEKLHVLRNHGINRLSFGVQTFSRNGLRLLGRLHDADTAIRAIEMAAKAGFDNISLDLINGWPGQTDSCLENDLEISIKLPIQHISSYTLMLEPCCREYAALSSRMSCHDDDEERDGRFWDSTEYFLENNSFIHYETSNYALSDHMCVHNVLIWRGGEYLGLGAAAHSHLAGRRFANTNEINTYIRRSKYSGFAEVMSEVLTPEEKAREYAVFWLRLFEGINAADFVTLTGYRLQELYGEILIRLLDSGMVEWSKTGEFLRVPKQRQPVLDSVLVELI